MNFCSKCKSENPTHFFRCYGGGGQVFEKALCSECIEKMDGAPIALIADDLICVSSNVTQFTKEQMKEIADVECLNCHTTLDDVNRVGWFGCEVCYETFGELLNMADAQIENNVQDKSDLVGTFNDTVSEGKVEVLKRRMETAVASENYEEAGRLRDEINEINEIKKKAEDAQNN